MKSSMFNSFRFKLIAPVATALMVMIVCAVAFTVIMQTSNSTQLNTKVTDSFTTINKTIANDLNELSSQLNNRLQHMQEKTSGSLEKSSKEALEEITGTVPNLKGVRVK